MENCPVCKTSIDVVIRTDTQFGHGDSTHSCYAICVNCGTRTSSYGGYGLFENESFRKAQHDWDEGAFIKD